MQKYQAKRLAVACFFIMNVVLVSCTKDTITPEVLTAAAVSPNTTPDPPTDNSTGGSDTNNGNSGSSTGSSTSGSTGSSNASFSPSAFWKNRPDGPYAYTQANEDFKNVLYWDQAISSQIVGGKLKTTLAKNSLTSGGVLSRVNVEDGTEYQLAYDIMFDNAFDFSWGGKVGFGFLIGNGYTGGVPGTDGNGGSFRLMWYKNTSTGPVFLKPYVYYKDQPGTYGNDFGKAFPSTGSIEKGKWYTVRMYMKSNTGSNTDGRLRMDINGVTIIDQPIRWTTNDLKKMVTDICFETFRGGGESYWQSTSDGVIYFDNVSWTKLK